MGASGSSGGLLRKVAKVGWGAGQVQGSREFGAAEGQISGVSERIRCKVRGREGASGCEFAVNSACQMCAIRIMWPFRVKGRPEP